MCCTLTKKVNRWSGGENLSADVALFYFIFDKRYKMTINYLVNIRFLSVFQNNMPLLIFTPAEMKTELKVHC